MNHRGAPYQTVILPVCVTQNHPAHVSNSNVRRLTNKSLVQREPGVLRPG